MFTRRLIFAFLLMVCAYKIDAQEWQEKQVVTKSSPVDSLEYSVEAQASVASGTTPLWLNANKYGLSSLDKTNGYLRAGVERDISHDRDKKWGIGYGVDLAVPYNYTSNFIIQQAYAEVRWKKGQLTVGSKHQPMELKSGELSSGSQALGINARPTPMVRLALPEYWILPFANGWLRFKGHIAYGLMTDEKWQQDFTDKKSKYGDDIKIHTKAAYLKIGNEEKFIPWSMELGLEMACTYGGSAYIPNVNGEMVEYEGQEGFKGAWNAFIHGGQDAVETTYTNASGNTVGSWVMRLNYDNDDWGFSVYADKFFEDHSAMLGADYDGYGSGDDWEKKVDHRFFIYDLKDWMLGAEFRLSDSRWFDKVVAEYIYTKYQSGAIYHDHTRNIPDHIAGRDDYYNNYVYPGWQHWGQVMGNPLYRSPIYNTDGIIAVKNNKFMAFHLGVQGTPTDNLSYRLLASWQEGFGSDKYPYTHKRHNVSMMAEAKYEFSGKLKGWSVTGAYGMDLGSILGHNYGGQLTITKKGVFGL